MITGCPQCNTYFRVTPEQLAIRQGVVRCGCCDATFNGFATLLREKANNTLHPPSPQPHDARLTPITISDLSGRVECVPPEPSWEPAVESASNATGRLAPNPGSLQNEALSVLRRTLSGRINGLPPTPIWSPGTAYAFQDEGKTAAISDEAIASNESARAVADENRSAESYDEDALLGLTVRDEGGADSSSPPVVSVAAPHVVDVPRTETVLIRPEVYEPASTKSGKWIAVYTLLGVLLLGQAAYLLRSEIAANWPEVRPSLIGLCTQLGCDVPLPKQLDRLTIEASEMQVDSMRPNVILVTAILRNRGAILQAYPLLEVTLTDSVDRPVARRSLEAAEYLNANMKPDEGFAPNSETVTRTAIETIGIKPSGYRLRIYYR